MFRAPFAAHAARSRHHDRARGNFERLVRACPIDAFVHEVEHRRGARQNDTGREHCARADHGTLIHAAIAPDERIVLDDDRRRIHRLEHAANLGTSAQMDAFADLRTRYHQRVRIHHAAGTDPRADIDVHGRHVHHAARHVRAPSYRGSAWHDTHALRLRERLRREKMLVEKPERRLPAERHVLQMADPEAKQNALFDPRHSAPATHIVTLGGAHVTPFERAKQRVHHALRIVERQFVVRHRQQRFDTLAHQGRIQIQRARDHGSAPIACRLARTAGSSSGRSGTSGRRRTFWIFPMSASAALAGIGFDSMKAADVHGASRSLIRRAAATSPACRHSVRRDTSRGATLDVTETTPSPPAAITATVKPSSPDSTVKSGGRSRRISMIWPRLPEASLMPPMFGTRERASVVRASMLLPVRPGTLYRITGSSVAAAIAVKCAMRPRCGGLLYIGLTCTRCVAPALCISRDCAMARAVSLDPAPASTG